MHTPRYNEFPPAAPAPRCWKSLGHLVPGVEMSYAIDNLSGDMDIDREADLRAEMTSIANAMNAAGTLKDGTTLVRQARWPEKQTIIRYSTCDCGGLPPRRFACEWN